MQLGGKEPLENRSMPHQLSDTVEEKLLVFVTMYIPKYIAKTNKEFLIAKQSSLAKSVICSQPGAHAFQLLNIKPKAKIPINEHQLKIAWLNIQTLMSMESRLKEVIGR